EVAKLLDAGGARTVVVKAEGAEAGDGALARAMAEAVSDPGRPLRGVVHLWGIDVTEPAPAEAALRHSAGSLVEVVQALGRSAITPPRLWVVTRGAQPIGAPGPLAVAQAPLWGVAKSIRLEHPELGCVSVDLDPEADGGEQAGISWPSCCTRMGRTRWGCGVASGTWRGSSGRRSTRRYARLGGRIRKRWRRWRWSSRATGCWKG